MGLSLGGSTPRAPQDEPKLDIIAEFEKTTLELQVYPGRSVQVRCVLQKCKPFQSAIHAIAEAMGIPQEEYEHYNLHWRKRIGKKILLSKEKLLSSYNIPAKVGGCANYTDLQSTFILAKNEKKRKKKEGLEQLPFTNFFEKFHINPLKSVPTDVCGFRNALT